MSFLDFVGDAASYINPFDDESGPLAGPTPASAQTPGMRPASPQIARPISGSGSSGGGLDFGSGLSGIAAGPAPPVTGTPVGQPGFQTATGTPLVTTSSQQAMENYQRSPTHYQPGVQMSQPLTALGQSGQKRGDVAQAQLGTYATGAAKAGALGQQAGQAGQAQAAIDAQTALGAGQTGLDFGRSAIDYARNDASNIRDYGLMAQATGQTGQTLGLRGAQEIGSVGGMAQQFGTVAAQQAGQAASGIANSGIQTSQYGQNAAQQAQQAASGIVGAAQTGLQTGQQAQQAANRATLGITGAGEAGQAALSGIGLGSQQLGSSAASTGQSFLGDRGYQAQMGDANQARGTAQGQASQLSGIEAQEGPSAAQAQLRSGLNQAQSSNLAMARSQRGFGGGASALRNAQGLNAQAGQQAANQSAMLRAQENAAFRQRQAQNLGTAANVNLNAGQQAMAREQMLGAQQQATTDANRQSYLASQGLGLQGLSQQAAAEAQGRQMALSGQQAAAQTGIQGAQLGMQGAQMDVSAREAAAQAALQGSQLGVSSLQAETAARQAAAQAALQGNQLGMTGLQTNVGAQQAAAQTGMQGVGMAMTGDQAAMQAMAQAGALRQQGIQSGLQGASLNMTGAQTAAQTNAVGSQLGMSGAQIGMQGQTSGGQLTGMGAQLGFQGDSQMGQAIGMDMAAKLAYEQMLTQQMGIEAGVAVGNAQASNLWDAGLLSAGGTALGMAGSSLMSMSDVNAKTDITPLGATDTLDADNAAMGREGMMADYSGGSAGSPSVGGSPTTPGEFTQKNPGALDKTGFLDKMKSPTLGAALGNTFIDTQKSAYDGAGTLGSIAAQGDPGRYELPLTSMYRAPSPFGFGFEPMGVMSDKRAKDYYAVSDEKAKRDAGQMVDKLDPYAFKYKDPERHGAGQHFGIMAQDLERSEAGRTVVEEGPDGLKRVNTPKLTMLNSAALAQYDDRLGELEKRIERMGKKPGRAA